MLPDSHQLRIEYASPMAISDDWLFCAAGGIRPALLTVRVAGDFSNAILVNPLTRRPQLLVGAVESS